MSKSLTIPPLHTIKSSSIAAIGHADGALFVRFAKGATYRYRDVTPAQYDELRKAESVGRHLQVKIMSRVSGELVKEPEREA
jgi:hypothetical protein